VAVVGCSNIAETTVLNTPTTVSTNSAAISSQSTNQSVTTPATITPIASSGAVDQADWKTYINTDSAYSFRYPANWAIEQRGKSEQAVVFTDGDTVKMQLQLRPAPLASAGPIWMDHQPVGDVTVDGIGGHEYHYTACDAGVCSDPIVAVVLPYAEDTVLGILFYNTTSLDAQSTAILNSFVEGSNN
jgi:hypothetical protein